MRMVLYRTFYQMALSSTLLVRMSIIFIVIFTVAVGGMPSCALGLSICYLLLSFVVGEMRQHPIVPICFRASVCSSAYISGLRVSSMYRHRWRHISYLVSWLSCLLFRLRRIIGV